MDQDGGQRVELFRPVCGRDVYGKTQPSQWTALLLLAGPRLKPVHWTGATWGGVLCRDDEASCRWCREQIPVRVRAYYPAIRLAGVDAHGKPQYIRSVLELTEYATRQLKGQELPGLMIEVRRLANSRVEIRCLDRRDLAKWPDPFDVEPTILGVMGVSPPPAQEQGPEEGPVILPLRSRKHG